MTTEISVSVKRACELVGCGRTFLYAAVAAGELPARKHGKKTVFLVEDLMRWVRSWPTLPIRSKNRSARQTSQPMQQPRKVA